MKSQRTMFKLRIKDLRIEKMTELDRYMRAGFTLVFVDESHWNLANVRTRKWGEKGKKHFPGEPP